MSNRAWMPLHIDLYLADTGHLTAAEHGAYMLLIMHYWRDGGLPADERLIQRIARLSKEQWEESRDILASLFKDGWSHKRIDEELAKADGIIAKRKAAADAMHGKRRADANAEHVHGKSSDTGGNTFNQEPKVKEEPSGSSKKRASRLPADWTIPEDWIEEAVAAGLSRSKAYDEADRMRDWSLSNPKGVKLDWRAMWRNWFKDKVDKPQQRGGAPPKGKSIGDMFRDDAIQAGLINEQPTRKTAGNLDSGNGQRQDGRPGISRQFAIKADFLGSIG